MELVLLLERKIYITLNLLSAPVFGLQKEKEIINTLTRALDICWFYYVEILKHAQDPHKHTGWQDFLTTKGFSVLHQNIRGMEGKKDLVAYFLFNNKVNIFSLSETFLSHKNFTDVEIGVYSFEYKNRKQMGGGVGAISKRVFRTHKGRIWNLII